jgi:cell division protein FtsN
VPPSAEGGVSQFIGSVAMNASVPVQPLRYRVIVEAHGRRAEQRMRSLVPNAFATVLEGRSVFQAGAFGDRANAEDLVNQLERNGLNASVEAMND